ncbi:hypothetical protein OKW26_004700 [Paraburkholderia sp. 32]
MNSPAASDKKPAAPVKRAAGRNLNLPEDLKAYQGVWVFLEHDRGHVHSVSWELLGEAGKPADKLGSRVAVAVLGGTDEPLEQFASEAFSFGADKAYVIHDPVSLGYRNEPFTKEGADRPGQQVPLRDSAARCNLDGPGSRRICRNDALDRPHRRLH